MDKHFNVATLIENLDDCLDKLFVSGFGVATEAGIQELRQLAGECERFGLGFGSTTLENMAGEWKQKRHSLAYDTSGLARNLCGLDLYLSVIRSKLELATIADSMQMVKVQGRNSGKG